jgi:hypothetical protein
MYGPFATAHDLDELIDLSKPLFDVARGHEVQRWVVQDDQVSALYQIRIQGPRGIGMLTTGGWFTVAGDRLASGQVIYDGAAFNAILTRP